MFSVLIQLGCRVSHASFDLKHTIAVDDEFESDLQDEPFWLGGDGMYSMVADSRGGKNDENSKTEYVWFSDTMIGRDSGGVPGKGFRLIHNSMAVKGHGDSGRMRFVWNRKDADDGSLFKPPSSQGRKGHYLWLGDGFLSGRERDVLNLFCYRVMDTLQGVPFAFQVKGNGLISLSLRQKDFPSEYDYREIPFCDGLNTRNAISFGAAVLEASRLPGKSSKKGFNYVYGVRGPMKEVYVARFRPKRAHAFSTWRFFSGNRWVHDAEKATPVADSVSNEMSVTAMPDGRFLMVFMTMGIGTRIGARVGMSPWGPFGPVVTLDEIRDPLLQGSKVYAYNAKVQRVLSREDEWMVSYHMNSFDFWNDIRKYPDLYRPRFLKMSIKPKS